MGVGAFTMKSACANNMAYTLYLLLKKAAKEGFNLQKYYFILSKLLKHMKLEEGSICSESSKSTLLLYKSLPLEFCGKLFSIFLLLFCLIFLFDIKLRY